MRELKSRLVDGGRVEHGRLGNLKDVRGEARVESALWQRKAIHAAVPGYAVIEVVPGYQSVAGVYRVVDARAETGETRGQHDALANLHDVVGGIQNCRSDNPIVVLLVSVHFQEERSLSFFQRPAKITAHLAYLKRRAFARVNLERIRLREFKLSSLKLNEALPRILSEPGRVRISIRAEG